MTDRDTISARALIAYFSMEVTLENHIPTFAARAGAVRRGTRAHPSDHSGALQSTKERCVFTTHTPVPAGHDRFPLELARSVLGAARVTVLQAVGCCKTELNMTHVGLTLSQRMLPQYVAMAYPG